MHRRPVVSAFALAAAAALVSTFAIGPWPRGSAAQEVAGATASPLAASGDFAGLVDIGGRSLYLECRGTGSPSVVLVTGYRSSARYWTDDLLHPDAPRTMVLPGAAEFTRVCAYDRPGTYAEIDEAILPSRSDAITQPRTAPEVVAELHALLQAAEIPGPYVLAAHSLSGLLARLYAATYPDEIVGLVLVDAFSERLETILPPDRADVCPVTAPGVSVACTTMSVLVPAFWR
jgi:pimeloyl-ACP methyl ester carboxylesterase